MVSALSNCFCNLLVSLSNSLTLRARGLMGLAFLPRFFGARPSSFPFSRCFRHVVRWDEYRPSRLNRAPIAPCLPLQASASSMIFFLYRAENPLLCAFAGTSGSGLLFPNSGTTPNGRRQGLSPLRVATLPSTPRTPGHHGSCLSSTIVSSLFLVSITAIFLSHLLLSTLIYHGLSAQSL